MSGTRTAQSEPLTDSFHDVLLSIAELETSLAPVAKQTISGFSRCVSLSLLLRLRARIAKDGCTARPGCRVLIPTVINKGVGV